MSDPNVYRVYNGNIKCPKFSSREARTDLLEVTGSTTLADTTVTGTISCPSNFFMSGIRGVALGLGVGVLKYDSLTKEIVYSTT